MSVTRIHRLALGFHLDPVLTRFLTRFLTGFLTQVLDQVLDRVLNPVLEPGSHGFRVSWKASVLSDVTVARRGNGSATVRSVGFQTVRPLFLNQQTVIVIPL